MDDLGHFSRRRLLAGLASGGTLVALAGCAESNTGTEADTDANGTESEPPAADDLDLREANVVDVAFEATDGGYAFDVTLHHDDDGEEGYANWWQVERLDGTRLGRRELLHAHSEQPFTRSATVAIPDDIIQVVVRGHDQTHGYGGVAALVAIDDGSVRFIDQGPEPRSFDAGNFS
ncbi:hypothetical protein [Halorubrum sp. GN12_10-3_MGM]|uniref:hypothetical protein n=1 Tax=Halorubrum sp. GN12_10-3_MGM TaxID=2518113 RepID=UPI0010F7426C|nr:hypothetical protein [Halorubrum sp. GN12_10-3_MGM]TKX64973.1 hypothetical protein EXE47_08680 [Halorubrum sp. GN12_10-3_MGM]